MRYIAKHSLKYNGKLYGKGDEVPLTEKEAADLLKSRVVEKAQETPEEPVSAVPAAPASAKAETPAVDDATTQGEGVSADAEGEAEEGAEDEAEADADAEPAAVYTEESLKKLTKKQQVALAKDEFGLELNVRCTEQELVDAILAAQAKK